MSSFYKLVLKESLTDSPFAPKKKEIAPAVAAALIAGGSSVLGSLFGGASQAAAQREANETNLQIARETNKQNRELYEYQLAQNALSWQKQNEYNDPANVVQRLKNAGINPATAYGDINTPASQIASPSMPEMKGAQVAPVQSLFGIAGQSVFDGVQQGFNAYYQNQLLNSQIREKDVDTGIKSINLQFAASEKMYGLYEKMADVSQKMQNVKKSSLEYNKLQEEYEMLKVQHNLLNDTYNELREREGLQNDVMRANKENILADTTLKRVQSQYQSMLTQFYPKITQAELALKSQELELLVHNCDNAIKDGKLTSEKATAQWIENQLKDLVFKDERIKHGIKNGKNQATKSLYYFSDYLGSLIFGNVRLFGK